MAGQSFVLDAKADAEQQRKDRQRLEIDEDRQEPVYPAVEARIRRTSNELLEDGDSKLRLEIHGEHAKQRQAAQGVEGIDALGGWDGHCRDFASLLCRQFPTPTLAVRIPASRGRGSGAWRSEECGTRLRRTWAAWRSAAI